MPIFIFILFATMFLNAMSIDSLVNKSISKHNSLDAIKYRLSSMDEKIKLSAKWDNPQISLSIGDIQSDRPFDRGIEPMQYNAIDFTQKFPWGGKLKAKEKLSIAQRAILLDSFSEAKVELALQVRITAYGIKGIREQIYIMKRDKSLLQNSISLYSSYLSTDNSSHNSSMMASLSLSQIKIKLESYNSILKANRARLDYLVNGHYSVSNKLSIKAPKSLKHYLNRVNNNATYKKMLSKSNEASAKKDIEDLSIYPDPFVKVGYFNRTEFNDYASISVGVSLPIYGREKLSSQIAQKEFLASKSDILEYKSILKREINIEYAKLIEAYKIYNILKYESLPKLKHIFQLSQVAIQNGNEMVSFVNLLTQKALLEDYIVSLKVQYLQSQSRLNALIGEI